jgi:hypothetical protein
MSDLDVNELASTFLRTMQTVYRQEGVRIGQSVPARLVNHLINPFGTEIRPEDAQTFAVGYDSGTGTSFLAFTPDRSVLTDDPPAAGMIGDILTG